MNYISARHKFFSDHLIDSNVLTNPEKYFGPNYKTLLNFWIYWETLTSGEKINVLDRQLNITKQFYFQELLECAGKFITVNSHLYFNELEIICANEILESGKSLVFLPLLENL